MSFMQIEKKEKCNLTDTTVRINKIVKEISEKENFVRENIKGQKKSKLKIIILFQSQKFSSRFRTLSLISLPLR